jgi:hypothetical protein
VKHVAGFEIPVDHTARARGVEGRGDLDRDGQRLLERQRPFSGARRRLLLECSITKSTPSALPVEQRTDMRMAERRNQARFAVEPFAELRVNGQVRSTLVARSARPRVRLVTSPSAAGQAARRSHRPDDPEARATQHLPQPPVQPCVAPGRPWDQ